MNSFDSGISAGLVLVRKIVSDLEHDIGFLLNTCPKEMKVARMLACWRGPSEPSAIGGHPVFKKIQTHHTLLYRLITDKGDFGEIPICYYLKPFQFSHILTDPPRAAGAYGLRHLAANCSLVASFVQTAAVLQGSFPLVCSFASLHLMRFISLINLLLCNVLFLQSPREPEWPRRTNCFVQPYLGSPKEPIKWIDMVYIAFK